MVKSPRNAHPEMLPSVLPLPLGIGCLDSGWSPSLGAWTSETAQNSASARPPTRLGSPRDNFSSPASPKPPPSQQRLERRSSAAVLDFIRGWRRAGCGP